MNELLREEPYTLVYVDHETACVRNSQGKQLTFRIAPEVDPFQMDKIVESRKRSRFHPERLAMYLVTPMYLVPEERPVEKGAAEKLSDKKTNEPVTCDATAPKLAELTDIPPREVKRMMAFAQKKIFENIESRVRRQPAA